MAKTVTFKGAIKNDKPMTKKQFEAMQKQGAKKANNTKKK